jgi:arylsulfatase
MSSWTATTADNFTGTINWVPLDQADDNHDHLISPEDRLKVAMTRQ